MMEQEKVKKELAEAARNKLVILKEDIEALGSKKGDMNPNNIWKLKKRLSPNA